MNPLKHSDLMSLEEYDRKRPEYREMVIAHKKNRQVALGPNARLYFEDRITMQYQVQEILRIEKIFQADGIDEELEAYNPLIPDGGNWKATFMIEYEDEAQRRQALARLIGIERRVWVRVGELDPVHPVANEDLVRETGDKTSAVHFLRFELTPEMIMAARSGAPIQAGVDHPGYAHESGPLPANIAESLAADLDPVH